MAYGRRGSGEVQVEDGSEEVAALQPEISGLTLGIMKTTALSLIVLVSSVTLPAFGQQGKAATAADSKFQIPATDEGLPGSGPIRRYDWFKNLWQKKRSGWAKDVEKDQSR